MLTQSGSKVFVEETSDAYLAALADKERLKSNAFAGVRSILVVLSSRAVTADVHALKARILAAYPEAQIYFRTTAGQPFQSPEAPSKVDLLIDFTGPGMKQSWFAALGLRARAKHAVGRNAGLFRKGRYDRVYDEKSGQSPSKDVLVRERLAQKKVLELAGIASIPAADATEDRALDIALDLPPLRKN